MTITIADDRLVAELADAGGRVEMRSRDGRILGVFEPARRPPEPEISEEEMARLLTDPNTKWYTASEVEAKMREWRCTP